MSIERKYPLNSDPRMKSILEALYNAIDELQRRPATAAISAADRLAIAQQAATQAAGLLGPFATPVLGQAGDPLLANIGTGDGTVTSIAFNAAFAGGTITGSGSVSLVIGSNNRVQKSDGTKLVNSTMDDDGTNVSMLFTGLLVFGTHSVATVDNVNGLFILDIAQLPVIDPGVSGALWNNLGVINVSP